MYRSLFQALAFVLFLGVYGSAEAQTITRKTTLLSASAGTNINASGPAAGAGFVPVPANARALNVRVVADNDSGTTPTLDVAVWYCAEQDNATCKVLYAFPQCTAEAAPCWTDGFKVWHRPTDTNVGPYLKVVYTLGGTSPVYDLAAYLEWGL